METTNSQYKAVVDLVSNSRLPDASELEHHLPKAPLEI